MLPTADFDCDCCVGGAPNGLLLTGDIDGAVLFGVNSDTVAEVVGLPKGLTLA